MAEFIPLATPVIMLDKTACQAPGSTPLSFSTAGVPESAIAVSVRASARFPDGIGSAPSGRSLVLKAWGKTGAALIVRGQEGGYFNDESGIVPLGHYEDGGGPGFQAVDFYLSHSAYVEIEVDGYFS